MAAAAVAVVVVVGAAITAVVLNSQDGKPRSGPIDYSTVSPPASAPSASNGPQGQYKPVADLCPHVDTDTLQQALGQLAASPSPGTVSNLGPEGDTALCTTTYGGSGTTVQISATVAADRATARGAYSSAIKGRSDSGSRPGVPLGEQAVEYEHSLEATHGCWKYEVIVQDSNLQITMSATICSATQDATKAVVLDDALKNTMDALKG